MKSDVNKFKFTEDLDYSQTTRRSIWGDGDPETLQFLKKIASENKLFGKWLHFAAGDGRYNNLLLQVVNEVVVTDVDKNALDKLQKNTPKKFLPKLLIKTQDITKPFPFKNEFFDGVFNTGTLHLFPKSFLKLIFQEVYRILKPGGQFIFDFATDIKRVKKDGSLVGRSSVNYTKHEARTLMLELLERYKFKNQFNAYSVPPEKVTSGDGTYTFSCNYWLVNTRK